MDGMSRETLRVRLENLLDEERRIGFDPGGDDNDYAALLRDFGYDKAAEVGVQK